MRIQIKKKKKKTTTLYASVTRLIQKKRWPKWMCGLCLCLSSTKSSSSFIEAGVRRVATLLSVSQCFAVDWFYRKFFFFFFLFFFFFFFFFFGGVSSRTSPLPPARTELQCEKLWQPGTWFPWLINGEDQPCVTSRCLFFEPEHMEEEEEEEGEE